MKSHRLFWKGFVKFTQPHNCRYLRHLPVTSNFEVCEIRLDVSKETAAAFKEQLDARHVKRRKRARDEKRREKRIQVRPAPTNPCLILSKTLFKIHLLASKQQGCIC